MTCLGAKISTDRTAKVARTRAFPTSLILSRGNCIIIDPPNGLGTQYALNDPKALKWGRMLDPA
jgi:hypothetical protein